MPLSAKLYEGFWPGPRYLWVLIGTLFGLWVAVIYLEGGNGFYAFDYMLYLDQAAARNSDPTAIYAADDAVPYPPLFAWMFTPFTWVSQRNGFLLWTGLNVLATLHLARRVNEFRGYAKASWVPFLLLVSFPIGFSTFTGQVQVLLGCAFAEFFLGICTGRDVQAGLWLSCIVLKPQYTLLLGVCLIWKRQWRVLSGAVLGVALIAIGSVITVGLPATLAYPPAVVRFALHHDLSPRMANWRAIAAAFGRFVGGDFAELLAVTLSGLTATAVLIAQYGPWGPKDPRFAAKMCLLMLGGQLAGYHSHAYGPALFAVPIAAALAAQRQKTYDLIVLAGSSVPTLALLPPTTFDVHLAALLLTICLLMFGAALLRTIFVQEHLAASGSG
jgi:glycosyl transferase family 87